MDISQTDVGEAEKFIDAVIRSHQETPSPVRMVRMLGCLGLILACFSINLAVAGTIYTWTDADGVKRYSNAQPPEGTENVSTIEEVQGNPDNGDRLRQEYNTMVEEASQAADRHFEKQAQEKVRTRQADQQRKQEEASQQIEQQRKKLQQELESIKNRGLGPTFSAGQKDYLIEQIQQKIDQLDNQTAQ